MVDPEPPSMIDLEDEGAWRGWYLWEYEEEDGRVKNKVYRGWKTEFCIESERAGGVLMGEKYTWICGVCGRVWLMRRDAQRCNHTDYVFYGSHRVRCLGKVDLEKWKKRRR